MITTIAPMTIGNSNSHIAFYLPTPPLLPEGWDAQQANACAALIALNGNHWRKILTIMAKICMPQNQDDWRHYRDRTLLQREMILIGATAFAPHTQIHIISGHIAAQTLGITAKNTPRSPKAPQEGRLISGIEPGDAVLCPLEPQGKLMQLTLSECCALSHPRLEAKEPHNDLDTKADTSANLYLLAPYLDYRQYPNQLIDITRQQINR